MLCTFMLGLIAWVAGKRSKGVIVTYTILSWLLNATRHGINAIAPFLVDHHMEAGKSDDDDDDLSTMSYRDVQKKCKEAGLQATGTKEQLLNRLRLPPSKERQGVFGGGILPKKCYL